MGLSSLKASYPEEERKEKARLIRWVVGRGHEKKLLCTSSDQLAEANQTNIQAEQKCQGAQVVLNFRETRNPILE